MKYPRHARIFRGHLDIAPIAGVLFLLVIFLLLNSSLVFTPGVKIQLPVAEGQSMPGLADFSVVVAMDGNGYLYLENQVIQLDALRQRLAQISKEHDKPTLVLQADAAVRMDSLMRLSRMAMEAGILNIWLAAQPPANKTLPLWPQSP